METERHKEMRTKGLIQTCREADREKREQERLRGRKITREGAKRQDKETWRQRHK